LLICHQLGEEPDPDKMPLEISDFPSEIQVAFFIFGFLEDNWDGMSGSYMGKNWNNIEYLFNLYNIDEPRTLLYLMKLWEGILVAHRADKAQRKQKADERKSAGGGKNFTHNVKG
jgi:hypothetical protein|tara:strand:+ start:1092 stop:1436 length:345 start_codon:yes stop_codon:yes gene_type:complete